MVLYEVTRSCIEVKHFKRQYEVEIIKSQIIDDLDENFRDA